MTPFGLAALLAGIAALVMGLTFDWLSFDLIGLRLLAAVLIGFCAVARPSRLGVGRRRQAAPPSGLVTGREIEPRRVPKGSPAIAFLAAATRGRRPVPVAVATQPFGA